MARTARRLTTEGNVVRTQRAFREDLDLVMGSDPIKAIVELVTNADDAYVNSTRQTRTQKRILIEVERHRGSTPTIITVGDRADGMTWDEMLKKLGREGERASGFESGSDVRGLFGRGAKDVVQFGPVSWESTKDGKTNRFSLKYEGGPTNRYVIEPMGSTGRNRSGTTVRLEVQPQFVVPLHQTLLRKLSRHYQLRPCLEDRARRVLLSNAKPDEPDLVTYERPKGILLEAAELPIRGYVGQYLTLNLWESDESLDDGEPDDYWRHSLLIRSGRAAYEMFKGKFGREPWSAYLPHLFGEVNAPAIAELIREFDERDERGSRPERSNPIRLVRRDRSGLVPREQHPFIDALYSTLEDAMLPHLESIRRRAEDSGRIVRGDTARRLRDLGRLMSELLVEEDQSGDLETLSGTEPPLGVSLIPSVQVRAPGETARVVIRFRGVDWPSPVLLQPTASIEVMGRAQPTSAEIKLEDRGGYYSKAYAVSDLMEGQRLEVSVSVDGSPRVSAFIECAVQETSTVERLQFEHSSYSIKEGSRRTVKLLIPWELASEFGSTPRLQLTGDPEVSLVGGDRVLAYDHRYSCGAYGKGG